MEIIDLIGILASLGLGYVSTPFPIKDSFAVLSQLTIHTSKNKVVLPKTQVQVTVAETQQTQTIWQRIILMITDSWFFDWLKEEKKTIAPEERILLEKQLSKSKYSRVI